MSGNDYAKLTLKNILLWPLVAVSELREDPPEVRTAIVSAILFNSFVGLPAGTFQPVDWATWWFQTGFLVVGTHAVLHGLGQ